MNMALKDKLVNLEDLKIVHDETVELKSALDTVEGAVALGSDTLLPLAWESGSLSTTDGSEQANVSHRRTDYIPVTAGSIYVTYESPVSGCMVFWYDASKNYIPGSRTSWVSSGSTVAMNAIGVYYRILAKRSSSPTPLTADEIRTVKVLIAPIWDKDIFDRMQSIAKEYDTASSGYSVGEYCTHAGRTYICISPVSQDDAWDAEKWQETDVGAELKQANAEIAALESANLDATSVFQKYDATMSAIIKNFKMVSDTYKYVAISDIRRNYSSKTGFIMYYYDNDTYASNVRHTLLTAWGLSSSALEHYTKTFDNGGYVELDFDVSGQADGYRDVTTTATNRIKPAVIERIVETPYASNYGLNVSNFMLTSGNTPIFTWVDDDTDPTGVTRVKAICDTLGIKATFACVTDKLAQNSGALATTLLGYQEEGFHITSHSHTHTKGTENDPFWYPTDYTDVALSEADLIESLTTLNEYGFLDSNLFVTPGGNRNAALLKMISKWCPCVIGANGGANHKFGTGRANINRIFIRPEAEGGETLQTYKDMIDAAVTAGDWLIFGTHSGIPAQWDETLINNVLSYALTKNVDFMTLNQAWKIRKYNYDLYDMFT